MSDFSVGRAMRQASTLEKKGKANEAKDVYREILRRFPDNVRARKALAVLDGSGTPAAAPAAEAHPPKPVIDELMALFGKGEYAQVEEKLNKLTGQFASSSFVWNLLGAVYSATNRCAQAISPFARAAQLNPRYPEAHNNLGAMYLQESRSQEAVPCLKRAVELKPDYAHAWNNLGSAYSNLGQTEQAAASFRRAIDAKPDYGTAFRSLSECGKFTADDPYFALMRDQYATGAIAEEELCQLCFALARACEDVGQTAASFRYLSQANRLRKKRLGYDISTDRALFANIKSIDRQMPDCGEFPPAQSARPILITGMPRSGTTLVEQILASHSQVEGAGELVYLNQASSPLFQSSQQPDPEALSKLRQGYLDHVETISSGKPYVTDKMPHNFRWIGLVAHILPEARIIHVRRDPRAVCWSNFKHYFSTTALGYAYDLQDITGYHALYRDLMDWWHERYPGRIIEVDYERLTSDPERQVRQLVAAAGLEWEESCLSFHENVVEVNTASRQQVRQPIYTGSSDAWLRYENFLKEPFSGLPANVGIAALDL